MTEEIIEKIKKINDKNYNYGNEILYNACKDDCTDEKLKGLLLLVGRAYAASPERRSYGKSDFLDKQDLGLDSKAAPRWRVRGAADGTGSFFDEITEYMTKKNGNDNYKCNEAYEQYRRHKNALSGAGYLFDASESDKKLLISAISAVAYLNEAIRRSSERFDGVPLKNYKINDSYLKAEYRCENIGILSKLNSKKEIVTEPIRVKNQISFCSKFLHFHFPHTVFIIDQYSIDGGKRLVKFDDDNMKKGFLGEIEISKDVAKKIGKCGFSDETCKEIKESISCSSSKKVDNSDSEEQSLSDYIAHCLRAYAFCCFLKSEAEDITPRAQGADKSIESFPRLADAVFMSVKSTATKSSSSKGIDYAKIYDQNNII